MKIKEQIIKIFPEFKRQERLCLEKKTEKNESTKLCCVRSSMITKRKTLCKEGQYISLICQLLHYCNLQAIVFGSVCLC